VRHPYGHHAIQKPAVCSFIGTVNNIGGFLNDASGSRRYMATTILNINYAYKTEIDINQVWAQAYALYKAGESWILEGEEKTIVDETNKKFEIENPVAEMIQTAFTLTPKDETNFVSTVRLIEILHDKGWGSHNPVGESMVIATAAKILKLKKSYQMDDVGQLTRGYSGIKEKFPKI
jgi:hypothetical protein